MEVVTLPLPAGPPFPFPPPPPPSSVSCMLQWGTRKTKVNYISNHCIRKCKVLITYCCVTSYHTLTGLNQHTFVITQFLWVRSLGITQRGCHQGTGQGWGLTRRLPWVVSPPKLTRMVVGRTPPLWSAGPPQHSNLLQAASKGERLSLCDRVPE